MRIAFPSGRPERERLERALDYLAHHLKADCPLVDQAARWNSFPPYLCGTDQERAEELLSMWAEPALIWCGRGGYGATRILARLDESLRANPLSRRSRLLGYSDITAIFAFIRKMSLPVDCVHAPVVTEIPDHPCPKLVLQALHGLPCPLPLVESTEASRGFQGRIWGGNLAVLASLCGTPWLPNIGQGALLLEDVDEAPYRLDRFVTQLHDSGFFRGADGVFLGQFTKCGKNDAGLETVRQRLRELDIPLLGRLPVGHEAQHLPLFFDLDYRFDPETGSLQPQGDRVDALHVRTANHVAIAGD